MKALVELSHLESWLGKHANLVSAVLSDLLSDKETIRHATLQNWATIDFLLLAHGYGCEEFEGLSYFYLSNHSKGNHARIQKIQNLVQELKTDSLMVRRFLWALGTQGVGYFPLKIFFQSF